MRDRPAVHVAAAALGNAATRLGLGLEVVDVPLAEARDLYEADLALIRPDQVVAWRGSADRLDVDRVMRIANGHEPAPAGSAEER